MKLGLALLIALLCPGLVWTPARAQPALPATLPGGAPVPALPATTQQEILQRLLDAGAGRGTAAPPPPIQPGAARPAPAAPPPAPPTGPSVQDEPFSPIEAFFNARLTTPLRQFGHDSFQGGAQPGSGVAFGAVPEDYVIGRDDELLVSFRGRARNSVTARVTREGTLLLPEMQPIPAAGRSLRDLRADLDARVARELPGSEAFLSIGALRQVAVFVGGEVARPGMVVLSPLATVLDALIAAGGPRRTGSLRAIRVGGRVVDLYPVIAGEGGPQPDLRILEGERITVPPIGAVVAIGGEVSRPAIYELPAGAASQPLAAMLRLAGDTLRPSGHRFLLETTDGEGRRSFREISLRDLLRRGDALLVQPGVDAQAGGLRLSGHVATPLTRAVAGRGSTLRGLLSDPRLVRADPWLRMAVIWRADSRTRVRRLVPFDLGRLLQGGPDQPLQEGDEVILIGLPDVQWLSSAPVQRALRGKGASTRPEGSPAAECPALTALVTAARTTPQRFAHARLAAMPDGGTTPCPQLFIDYPALLPFLIDNAVLLMGEARLQGLLPILADTPLESLLEAAGGLTEHADLSNVELTRQPPADGGTITLQRTTLDLRTRIMVTQRMAPRDTLRIPRGFTDRDSGPVTLAGEFIR
ncbi:MAG: SLBB domain-containing protein, partial [Alphaproteobacteria bacterium]|nr:SLBB domain-containing protein [Alphaproteobacteria bacterium]